MTTAFAENAVKLKQWSGFVRKAGVSDMGSLAEAVKAVALFLAEPLRASTHSETFDQRWAPGGPWA